jgi:hypothetical protein
MLRPTHGRDDTAPILVDTSRIQRIFGFWRAVLKRNKVFGSLGALERSAES